MPLRHSQISHKQTFPPHTNSLNQRISSPKLNPWRRIALSLTTTPAHRLTLVVHPTSDSCLRLLRSLLLYLLPERSKYKKPEMLVVMRTMGMKLRTLSRVHHLIAPVNEAGGVQQWVARNGLVKGKITMSV